MGRASRVALPRRKGGGKLKSFHEKSHFTIIFSQLSRFSLLACENTLYHGRNSIFMSDMCRCALGSARIDSVEIKNQPSQNEFWSCYLGRSLVGWVKCTVVTFASSYFILLRQTMHRLNDGRIIVTLEHLNFLPKVNTFPPNFLTFNEKSIGWLR